MTDALVSAWLASHHLLVTFVLLAVLGTAAGLVRERTPNEEARFKASSPRLYAAVRAAQLAGFDTRKLVAWMGAIVTGNIVDALRVSSGTTVRPPPSTTVYPPERDHDDNP